MVTQPNASSGSRGRLLLVSYAFPPMQVQMTPAVYKPMAGIARAGYVVDVVCADSFCQELPLDYSLLPFAERTFHSITRLKPPRSVVARFRSASRVLARVPDLMTVLHRSAHAVLMDMDLGRYDAILTWSPFHSVNSVMVRVKKARPYIRWIAQFSDPWAGNPLEINRLTKIWNWRNEPRMVDAADFIVHSSRYSLDLMLRHQPHTERRKVAVIPHAYDEALYPQRAKVVNDRVVLRYVGILYGRRSPEPVFQALASIFLRRPDLRGKVSLELVGLTPPQMLQTPAALSLPEGTVRIVGNVSFVQSLELMYDADILLLVEANVRQNLFLASKLSDYMGARTPIVGLVPPGASEDALVRLGCWHARPDDVETISRILEDAISHVMRQPGQLWCDESYRRSFSNSEVAGQFCSIIENNI